MAAEALLSALGKTHKSYHDAEYETRADFEGDLDKMLFPAALSPEEEIYYQPEPEFVYADEVESNFDPMIRTQSLTQGSLVMYRDSFGNALLPFMAENFGSAYFSRGVPYQMSDLELNRADTLIVERAERFLPEMAANPPVMQAPLVLPDGTETLLEEERIWDWKAEPYGKGVQVSAKISNEVLDTDTRIFLQTETGMMYEAFPVCDRTGQEGFRIYLETEDADARYTILIK